MKLYDFCYRYKNADGEMKYGVMTLRAESEHDAEIDGKARLLFCTPLVWRNLDDTKILQHREHCSHIPPLEGF